MGGTLNIWNGEFFFPPGLKHLFIFADRGKSGEDAAAKLCRHALQAGIDAWVYLPFSKDDFNDDLKLGHTASEYKKNRPVETNLFNNTTTDLQVEVTPPPHGVNEVLAYIAAFDPNMTPAVQIEAIKVALKGIVQVGLDPIEEKACLLQIKARTGTDMAALKRGLDHTRGKLGLAQPAVNLPIVNEICRRYVHVKEIDSFWDRATRTLVSIDAVRNAHWSDMPLGEDEKRIDPQDILLRGKFPQGADKADRMSFLPGANEIFPEGQAVALNQWTPPDIIAVSGDATPFVDHLDYIFDGNLEANGYMLDYLAHLVQKPWLKMKVAPVIIGAQGIGKSLIADMMSKLLGENNTIAVEESNLRSPFNEWIDGVQLVIVHELMTMDKKETMNRLKTYITDPSLTINRKNVSLYRYINRANFLMFSNYEDAASIEEGDRRYFVWISHAHKRSEKYYTDIYHWFNNGGAEALLYFLQTRDISKFNPNAPALDTPSKQYAIEQNKTAAEAYLHAALQAGDPPFRHPLIVINDVIDYLVAERKMKVSDKIVAKVLREAGAVKIGQKRLGNDIVSRRPMVWALQEPDRWTNVDESIVAKYYRIPAAIPASDKERQEIDRELTVFKTST